MPVFQLSNYLCLNCDIHSLIFLFLAYYQFYPEYAEKNALKKKLKQFLFGQKTFICSEELSHLGQHPKEQLTHLRTSQHKTSSPAVWGGKKGISYG